MVKKSVSVIVPAYNEVANIEDAITDAKKVLAGIPDWELIVIEDGSTDGTDEILRKLKKTTPRMRILRHGKNMGFGQSIKDGIRAARKEYITQFHGDNDAAASSIRLMLSKLGDADLIVSYTADSHTRSVPRRIVSKLFVVLMNIIFGMKLRYFNGCFLCKRKLLQSVNLRSRGFAIYAEAKVRLIAAGTSYIEVPFEHTGRKHGKSKAVSIKSVWESVQTIASLIWDIYVRRNSLGTGSGKDRVLTGRVGNGDARTSAS